MTTAAEQNADPSPLDRAARLLSRFGLGRDWGLIVAGAIIGTVTAIGAIAFVELLHTIERLTVRLAGEWPWWTLPLFPMVGALATGLLVYLFAREAKGHGVPEVMDAVIRKGSLVRPRVALVKSLASACTIGSGGSAGAEGPIVQIGSALGSGVAMLFRVSREQATTLLGCGAAAGIASVFNAPIAGVFFVLEIILRDFSPRTLAPTVIASVFSTAVTQAILGRNEAIFAAGSELREYVFTLPELPSYVLLGLIAGVVAVAFVRALYAVEDFAEQSKTHPIVRPVIGAALLGALGLAYVLFARSQGAAHAFPPFFGNGYGSIRDLLDPGTFDLAANGSDIHGVLEEGDGLGGLPITLWALLALLLAKIAATSFTLGWGGSGGVFAPSLFMGATVGALFGVTLQSLGLLPEGSSPAAYALVGMAAVVAGTTHAPLTAILILFEITRDVYVLLPIMLAAVVSTVIAQLLLRDSIYTLKLRRRGVRLGVAGDWTILRRILVSEVPLVPAVTVTPSDPAMTLVKLSENYRVEDFVVVGADHAYAGLVTGHDIRTALIEREALPLLVVAELMRTDLPTVQPDENLATVMDKFSKHDASSLAVLAGDGSQRVQGLLTRTRLMARYQRALAETT